MKFEVENKKLQDLLNYLKVDTLFPTCVISTKNQKLYSSQTEAYGYAFRFALFDKEYFESINKDQDSVKIDVEKTLKIIKNIDPDEKLTIQYPSPSDKNKINIKGKTDDININTQTIEEGEAKEGLIFKMEKGIPILKADTDNPVKLDNVIKMNIESFKAVANRATALGTEFFSFNVDKKKKFTIRIGDLHSVSDSDTYKPKEFDVDVKEEVESVYTKGVNEAAKTFTADNVVINIKTNCPCWITSTDDTYRLGMLLPPYQKDEDEIIEENSEE